MNRENIKKVRDVIAKLPGKRFSMKTYISIDGNDAPGETPGAAIAECGTAACIAGWAVVLLAPDCPRIDIDDVAAGVLGLSHSDANELFTPRGYSAPGLYTRPHAVRVLDHLLATGEVDWQVTRRAKKGGA